MVGVSFQLISVICTKCQNDSFMFFLRFQYLMKRSIFFLKKKIYLNDDHLQWIRPRGDQHTDGMEMHQCNRFNVYDLCVRICMRTIWNSNCEAFSSISTERTSTKSSMFMLVNAWILRKTTLKLPSMQQSAHTHRLCAYNSCRFSLSVVIFMILLCYCFSMFCLVFLSHSFSFFFHPDKCLSHRHFFVRMCKKKRV